MYCNCTVPVSVSVQAPDVSSLSVSWTVPQDVLDQGITQFQVAVSAQCYDDDRITPPQLSVSGPDDPPTQLVTGLGNDLKMQNKINVIIIVLFVILISDRFVPYVVRLSAVICQSSVLVYNEIAFTEERKHNSTFYFV